MEAPLIPLKWLLVEADHRQVGVFLRSVLERMSFPSTCAGNYPSLPAAEGEQSRHTSFAEPCIGVKYTADAVKRRIAVTSTAFSPAPEYSRHARLDD